MKPPPFAYHAPSSLNEALQLLGRLENARVLAGGQSLMPMLNMRFAQPDHVVDINGITDLAYIRREGMMLEIGALTRQRDIEFSPLIAEACPLLREAILQVGHRQTRNRGTLGGSLCHLDPAAEMAAVAAIYGAELVIAGPQGQRTAAFAEFALDYMTTCLAPEEMLVAVRYPLWPAESGYCFIEYARRHGDFAIVSAGVLLRADASGRISQASLALGGVGAVPLKLDAIAAELIGKAGSPAVFATMAEACGDIDAMEDALITATYRRQLAKTLLRRALETAYARATGQPLPRHAQHRAA
ncbi:xanthine dehydrogenase family protein subunit M [Ferrovibrio sp.]|uniref:FAD binding domain-containing protein n=1 Tax=Ferrovibrio sp. TaxID=1917215 RepID=UPI0025C1EDDB|nr:xanthine dehydrogenase family protein subunit M [Ferrovibrio sp.]MBX3453662.1 xanthine dehydrogenase family protein subunit M [Ferrovibrio sp.]